MNKILVRLAVPAAGVLLPAFVAVSAFASTCPVGVPAAAVQVSLGANVPSLSLLSNATVKAALRSGSKTCHAGRKTRHPSHCAATGAAATGAAGMTTATPDLVSDILPAEPVSVPHVVRQHAAGRNGDGTSRGRHHHTPSPASDRGGSSGGAPAGQAGRTGQSAGSPAVSDPVAPAVSAPATALNGNSVAGSSGSGGSSGFGGGSAGSSGASQGASDGTAPCLVPAVAHTVTSSVHQTVTKAMGGLGL